MKKALVLSGGGSRGAYQFGVWKALRKLGIKIDVVITKVDEEVAGLADTNQEFIYAVSNAVNAVITEKFLATKTGAKAQESEEKNEIIGQSIKIREVKILIEKVAESDLTVLVTGENGTGKELIAKEIYRRSDRRSDRGTN